MPAGLGRTLVALLALGGGACGLQDPHDGADARSHVGPTSTTSTSTTWSVPSVAPPTTAAPLRVPPPPTATPTSGRAEQAPDQHASDTSAQLRGWLVTYKPTIRTLLDARDTLPSAFASGHGQIVVDACLHLGQAAADATGLPPIPSADVERAWRDGLRAYGEFAATCDVAHRSEDRQLAEGASEQLADGDESMASVSASMLDAQADGL